MNREYRRDGLYSQPLEEIVDFHFDDTVARIFPDMIQRSVPGYSTLIGLTGIIAGHYAQPNTYLYDLGCSVGATTLAMRAHLRQPDCRIIAVDNSAAMVDRCRKHIEVDPGKVPVEVHCADIQQVEIRDASVVILNLTLQFIAPEERLIILQRIYQGLRQGGVLVLSEKILLEDAEPNARLVDLHHAFKRANGYSNLEISQKRMALENVLIQESLERHRTRLAEAGFRDSVLWFQCLNFASLLAWK